ncbi:MAG: hypothetical protein M1814_000256 [Vezdaea aestivalis]|nr:MAG: hypothetical protein M1814_000256 [Vezdaea aestivalis]
MKVITNNGIDFTPPDGFHLNVTTRTKVYQWAGQKPQVAFSSGAGGIVNSKSIANDRDLLAVADSLVVILHNVGEGMHRSYRLKGSEGRLRLLEYEEASRLLFFTTTLLNSVQTYSLDLETISTCHPHPSPPTTLAFSCSKMFMLSTSAKPPTILLQKRMTQGSPVFVIPSISSSAVVVAAFHPTKENVFLLAFSDSTIAVYSAGRLLRDGDKARRGIGSRQGGELGNMKLSQFESIPTQPLRPRYAGSHTVKNQDRGIANLIADAAFFPGQHIRVAIATSDGRCLITAFDSLARKGEVLCTWTVESPITALVILNLSNDDEKESSILATGREDGKVDFFDRGGSIIGRQDFGSEDDHGPIGILGLEWARDQPRDRLTNESENPGSLLGGIPRGAFPKLSPNASRVNSTTRRAVTNKYMDLFSPCRKAATFSHSKRPAGLDEDIEARSTVSGPLLWNDSSANKSNRLKRPTPPDDTKNEDIWLAQVSGNANSLHNRRKANISDSTKTSEGSRKTVSFATAEEDINSVGGLSKPRSESLESYNSKSFKPPSRLAPPVPPSSSGGSASIVTSGPTRLPPPAPSLSTDSPTSSALRREMRDLALDTRRALLSQKIAFETALATEQAARKKLKAEVEGQRKRIGVLEARLAAERRGDFGRSGYGRDD